MLPRRIVTSGILFLFSLFLFTGNIYSQVNENGGEAIDTSDYAPMTYRGAIDHNLMVAASKGYAKETLKLILLGADIFEETSQGATALIFAVAGNHTEAAKILIEYGSVVNKLTLRGETPLILAVKNQNADLVETLIREDADVDLAGRSNATPLHFAAAYGYMNIADMLLYYNASVDKKTDEGTTPLLAAVWAGNADIADLLIQNGANIEARDNEGFTPFLMAALNGDTLLMDLMYKKGADIYELNNAKQNALSLAILSGSNEALEYLFRIGKHWINKIDEYVDPYYIASKYRRKEMIGILKENNLPGKVIHAIDQVELMLSTKLNFNDIYTGASLSFREPYLNGGVIIGFDTKLWYTRVFLKQAEHYYYQYWNKGSIFYTGLFKDFSLTNNPLRGNFSLTASIAGGYYFRNVLKGTLNAPGNKLIVLPSAGAKWTYKSLSVYGGFDYMKSAFYNSGPVWFRLGASYKLYFDHIRPKEKTLKWY